MLPHVSFPELHKCYKYDLFAVVNHFGSMQGGHYTAVVKAKGNWFEYNDSSVTKVSESKVRSASAYILFYKRKDLD